MLDEVDEQVPAYGTARATFRGISEMRDALLVGKEFLRKAPEVVRRELQKMSPPERDFYRLGAAQALYERVAAGTSETANVSRQFFGGRLFGGKNINADRLRALFIDAPEVADDFMRMVAAEARISHTSTSVATRAGQTGVQELEQAVEGSPPPTVRATFNVMVANIVRAGVVRARTGWGNDVSDHLAVMFAKGITDANELRAMLMVLGDVANREARRGLAGTVSAIGVGEAVGQIR
jgi:hypothetical protein